ncbi:hypothetical protein [Pseudarthrobacter sp. H2]|uniref:aromatic-ring hydroxylase C-terminal domain-containing protein n=1 Tax=Pseudarthrobacter sp. H2 TaxID=3418415 RepID=UPI003CEE3AAD
MGDGGERPSLSEDALLHHQKSTFPGLRLPHAWLGDQKSKYSTHDIAKGTGFTIFTGITGQAWADAAVKVAERLGIQLTAVVIGEGREVQDLYGDWLRQREIGEDGVILVRPDKHIGWRAHGMVEDPETALSAVLSEILSRGGENFGLAEEAEAALASAGLLG